MVRTLRPESSLSPSVGTFHCFPCFNIRKNPSVNITVYAFLYAWLFSLVNVPEVHYRLKDGHTGESGTRVGETCTQGASGGSRAEISPCLPDLIASMALG